MEICTNSSSAVALSRTRGARGYEHDVLRLPSRSAWRLIRARQSRNPPIRARARRAVQFRNPPREREPHSRRRAPTAAASPRSEPTSAAKVATIGPPDNRMIPANVEGAMHFISPLSSVGRIVGSFSAGSPMNCASQHREIARVKPGGEQIRDGPMKMAAVGRKQARASRMSEKRAKAQACRSSLSCLGLPHVTVKRP